jgi:hypothetical protein
MTKKKSSVKSQNNFLFEFKSDVTNKPNIASQL